MLLLSGLIVGLFGACLFADPVEVFNLEHTGLGQAVLTAGPDELTVSNIGSSGDDGVIAILPGGPKMWGMKLLDPLVVGASMEIKSYGTVDTVPDQMICSIQMSNPGSEGVMGFDFSVIDANVITIEYFYQGQRVLQEDYTATTSLSIIIQSGGGGGEISILKLIRELLGIPDETEGGNIRISPSWEDIPGGVTVETPNANIVQVTEIRVAAGNAPHSLESLSRVDITANGLAAFTIINEWTELSRCTLCLPGDLNRDRYINLQDVALMAEHWLVCTAPGEPACTWTAQQSSKSVDRSISAIISELEQVYTPGMTRQEFFDEAVPDDGGEIGMPDSLHQVLDYVYDWLKAVLT